MAGMLFLQKNKIMFNEVFKQFVYESLSDYLKPKSQEEIRKSLGNLTTEQKLRKGARHGIPWLVQEALDEGADPSKDNNFAILLASGNGNLEIVKLLLKDKRVNPAARNNLAIQCASYNGYLEVVKLLLSDKRVRDSLDKKYLEEYEKQINTLKEGFSDYLKPKSKEEIENIINTISKDELLLLGVRDNNINLVKKAIDKGANPNYKGSVLFKWAAASGHYEILKMLLNTKYKPDISTDNNAAIKWAIVNDNYECVKLLINNPNFDFYVKNDLPLTSKSKNISHILDMAINNLKNNKILKLLLSKKQILKHLSREERTYYFNKLKELKEGFSDYLKPKSKEEIDKDLEKLNYMEKFILGIKENQPWLVEEMIKVFKSKKQNYKYVTPEIRFAWPERTATVLEYCCYFEYKNLIDLLIKNTNYTIEELESARINWCITGDMKYYINEIIKKRKNIMKEGFSDYLKPKSKEEIDKDLEKLNYMEKFIVGITQNQPWLVEEMIKVFKSKKQNYKHIMPVIQSNCTVLEYCCYFNYRELIDLLIKNTNYTIDELKSTLNWCSTSKLRYDMNQLINNKII
jgi:ankyrin repeat protein